MSRLIDLSHPLEPETPPWPGNPPTEISVLDAIPASRGVGRRPQPGDPRHANVTAFRTCNHTGTHMDAPTHFYHGLPTIDQIPLEHCVGPAVLVDVTHVGPRGEITPTDLLPHEEKIRCSQNHSENRMVKSLASGGLFRRLSGALRTSCDLAH